MKLIRPNDLRSMTGIDAKQAYELEKTGNFPQRVRLGPRMSGWLSTEVDKWLANLPRGGCPTPQEAIDSRMAKQAAGGET